jgi:hypothetical protein
MLLTKSTLLMRGFVGRVCHLSVRFQSAAQVCGNLLLLSVEQNSCVWQSHPEDRGNGLFKVQVEDHVCLDPLLDCTAR